MGIGMRIGRLSKNPGARRRTGVDEPEVIVSEEGAPILGDVGHLRSRDARGELCFDSLRGGG